MLFETSKFKCSEKYEKKEKAITILRQEFQLKKLLFRSYASLFVFCLFFVVVFFLQ